MSFSHFHIDAMIKDVNHKAWHFSGFYGNPSSDQRHHGWHLLWRLANVNDAPWLCAGDFNEIMEDTDKCGGVCRVPRLMANFREAVIDAGLLELNTGGAQFSWMGKKANGEIVHEKLDRVFSNLE